MASRGKAESDPFAAFGDIEFGSNAPAKPGNVRIASDPTQKGRDDVIKNVNDQIALLKDPTYTVQRTKAGSKPPGHVGRVPSVTKDVTPRSWFYLEPRSGKYVVGIKRGVHYMEIDPVHRPGKKSALLGSKDAVEKFYEQVIHLVEEGYYDDQIKKLGARPGRKAA